MAVHLFPPRARDVVPTPPEGFTVRVSPAVLRPVARVLATVLVLLAAGHVVAMMWSDSLGNLSVLDLVRETSVGTWVTAVAHLACAVLAGVAGLLDRLRRTGWAANWWLLSAVFALMSLDEVAAVHERFSTPVRNALGTGEGLLYYAWVIPAGLFAVLFALVQLRFLRSLGSPTGRNLVLAGVVFVAGAVGLEMIEAALESQGLEESTQYGLLVLVEEVMELGAVMWVALTLLAHLVRRLGSPTLTVEPAVGEE